jgi:hypothetical protein
MIQNYASVVLAVRTIVFNTAGSAPLKKYGVTKPAQIPSWFNLGLNAPIGMTQPVILSMLPALNNLIVTERPDKTRHDISTQQMSATVNVGNLVDLVWAQIMAP